MKKEQDFRKVDEGKDRKSKHQKGGFIIDKKKDKLATFVIIMIVVGLIALAIILL